MTTKQVSLSKDQREFLEEQVAESGYASVEEYLQALADEAKKKGTWNKVESLVLEGLDSGPPIPATKEFWDSLRRNLH